MKKLITIIGLLLVICLVVPVSCAQAPSESWAPTPEPTVPTAPSAPGVIVETPPGVITPTVPDREEVDGKGTGSGTASPTEIDELVPERMIIRTGDMALVVSDVAAAMEWIVGLAEESSIPFRIDTFQRYGSDAISLLRTGVDVRHALVGPAVDGSHALERTLLDGIEATADLLAAMAVSGEPAAD